jgi:hypothetical protein
MSRNKRCWSRLVLLIIGLGLVGGLSQSTPTAAQDGPQCPPGFHFERMSGVGCVQDNCTSITGARYSYTGTCICGDEYKGCYGPIIAPDYDSALCFPFCPASQLLSCVSPDAACPELAPPVENPPAEQPAAGEEGTGLPAMPAEVEALLRDLEEFLTGEGHPISAGRSAAAAAAASALLTAWVIANLVGGARLDDLLQAVRRWLGGGQPDAGASPAHKPSLASGGALPGSGGKPPEEKVAGARPILPLQPLQPGKTPPVETSKPAQPPTVKLNATPPVAPPPGNIPPAAPGAQDQPALAVTPEQLKLLEDRFRQTVDNAIQNDRYVTNRSLVEKAWNELPGRLTDWMRGRTGGSCGDFSKWGMEWIKPHAEEIFGRGVVVDEIIISESSSHRPQVLIYDPIEWLDARITANHAATRVILPNGESYVLDYWQAVGDRQRGLYEKGSEIAYDQLFGGQRPYPEVRLIPEKEWIQRWAPRIGDPSDPAEVQNLHYAQGELREYLDNSRSEEEAFDRFRRARNPGVPPHQIETIINSYKKGGVWWGSKR